MTMAMTVLFLSVCDSSHYGESKDDVPSRAPPVSRVSAALLHLLAVPNITSQGLYELGEGATSVSHVVDQNSNLVSYISDQNHAADNVGARALLVNEGEASLQAIGNTGGTLGAARIGTDNDAVLDIHVLSDPLKDTRLGVQVVDGDIEESLDLRGVKVHRDDVVL